MKCITVLCCLWCIFAVTALSDVKVFEPTDEWQDIPDGVHIPRVSSITSCRTLATWKHYVYCVQGLHVKMDLTTGRKQAKNMSPDESTTSLAVAIDPASGSVMPEMSSDAGTKSSKKPPSDATTDVVDDMVRILQALPEPDESFTKLLQRRDSLSRAELATQMRELWDARQVILKDAMGSAKTEAQQMQEVLRQLIQPASDVDSMLGTLDDLTYFVTKKDNAVDFAGMGGLEAVAYLLNDTLPAVRSAASITLGTCVKYEPLLQQRAMALGVLPVLSANLQEATEGMHTAMAALRKHGANTQDSMNLFKERSELASRSVFALGAMCRGSPAVLQRLLDAGRHQLWQRTLSLLTPRALGASTDTMSWSEQTQMWHAQGSPVKTAVLRLVGKLGALLGDLFAEAHYQVLTVPNAPEAAEEANDDGVPITALHEESTQERELREQAKAEADAMAAMAESDALAAQAGQNSEQGDPSMPSVAGLFGTDSCAVLLQSLSVCLAAKEYLNVDVAEKLLTTAAYTMGATHQALNRDAREFDAQSIAAWSRETPTAQQQCQADGRAAWGAALLDQLRALDMTAFPDAQVVQRAARFVVWQHSAGM